MIEIEIPKDIKEYEPKFLGPFTLRQLIGVAGSALVMVVGYNVLKGVFDNGLKVIIPLLFAMIPFLIGYYKPYGLPFEKYFIVLLNTSIIPPKVRKYKTENLFEKEDIKEEAEQKKRQANEDKKKPKETQLKQPKPVKQQKLKEVKPPKPVKNKTLSKTQVKNNKKGENK